LRRNRTGEAFDAFGSLVARHSGVVAIVFSQIAAAAMHWQGRPGGLSFIGPAGVLPEFKNSPFTSSQDPRIHQERTMSIFGKIMSAIFGTSASATPASGGSSASGGAASSSASTSPAPAAPAQTVDVAAILDKAVAAQKEKLEWRTSIVDMMKALNIDSSLSARKELAHELGYTGDTNDSASMNIWLHKQMMAKLAANGGKLPSDIKW
jgi:hypothetical protein